MTVLRLSRSQSLRIVERDADRLVVVTTYDPGGTAPPAHYHPSQDEQFEVLAGTVRVDVDGRIRDLHAGETLAVTHGEVHRMWNPGSKPAEVRWVTTPAMATLEWFEGLNRLQAEAEARGHEKPDTLAFARLAAGHRDIYRLVVGGPKQVGDAVVTVLAIVARILRR